MRQDVTASMVAAVDWQVFSQNHRHIQPLLEDVVSGAAVEEDQLTDSPQELIPRLRGASVAEREQMLVSFLQQEIQAVMRLSAEPAPSVEFSDLGMDSPYGGGVAEPLEPCV